ncbi:MAG: penicillin acylase family protein [Ardenticatenia bacterium]|nr:penicillin acylase family protein [Ardenticatenia bacterium]
MTQRAQAELAKWDYRLEADSVGAGIFEVTYWFLIQEIVGDELGEELTPEYLSRFSQHAMFVDRLIGEPDSPWWDDTTTPERETRDEIVARALEKAVEWWGRSYGDLVDKDWTWGKVHTTTFRHPVLSSISPLDRLFNIEAGPTDGDSQTPQANGFSFNEPFGVRAGPGYRQIWDVGNWDEGRTVIAGGQSGHPMHPNFADLVPFWREVRYIPMPWSREAVEAAPNTRTLRLEPQP